MILLEIQNGSFAYGRTQVFDGIQCQIKKGQVFCLLGPNGCGKTTLLDCILGHQKLDRGRVLLEKRSIDSYKPQALAKKIAYVPQSHERSFPYRVSEMILMGRTPYTTAFSSPKREDVEIARLALERVGLADFQNRIYTQLSGGEAQLVLLARALAQKTPILLMDEPTAHLDFQHELKILETVAELVKEEELTVIMATHFPNHAFYFANQGLDTQVLLMDRFHQQAALGQPEEVLTIDNIEKIYQISARIFSSTGDKVDLIIPIKTL